MIRRQAEMTAEERWLPVVGWEGRYEVSDAGNLRDCRGRAVGQFSNDQGYKLARLSKPRALVRVHRLVALAFVPNPENKPTVNHIDCDRAHNTAPNLEWCTQQENLAHSERLGRMRRNYWAGKRSPNASLSEADEQRVRETYASGRWSLEALGRNFGMSKRAIGRLVSGQTYRPAPPEPDHD
jgi:hypothetical protein